MRCVYADTRTEDVNSLVSQKLTWVRVNTAANKHKENESFSLYFEEEWQKLN